MSTCCVRVYCSGVVTGCIARVYCAGVLFGLLFGCSVRV